MTRNGNTEAANDIAKAPPSLVVQTYYKGVANGGPIMYEKIEDGEYRYDFDFDVPSRKRGRTAYLINWKTGRYRFNVYALDYDKSMPVEETSGRCELVHPWDTPSIAGSHQ